MAQFQGWDLGSKLGHNKYPGFFLLFGGEVGTNDFLLIKQTDTLTFTQINSLFFGAALLSWVG